MNKNNKKHYTIGIDIGGTKMKAVLFDNENVITDDSLATPLDDLKHFMVMLKALIEPLEEKAREMKVKIKGIGLGVAGVIDYQEDRMLESPNLPIINGVKLGEELSSMIDLPVVMDNDANAFVRAEASLGAAKDYNNVYGVVIGTGIGGAWWINNNVYKGSYGGAGEPGHTIIELSSGLDLEKTYQKLTQSNPGKLAQEAYRADPLAEKAWQEVGRYLGVAFANIVNIIDPEAFALGGSVVESSDLFLPTLKKVMKEHIKSEESAKKIKVLKTKLGKDAGAIGAALLVS